MLNPAEMAALHQASFTTPRPWSEKEISDLITSPLIFTISQGGAFVMGRALAGEAELLTIAVAPELRRQGLGQKLLHAFLQEAKARDSETAFLEVAASNTGAIALYEAAGFAQNGRRRGYYSAPDGTKEDAILMSRTL